MSAGYKDLGSRSHATGGMSSYHVNLSVAASAYYEHSSSLMSRALYASLIKQLC